MAIEEKSAWKKESNVLYRNNKQTKIINEIIFFLLKIVDSCATKRVQSVCVYCKYVFPLIYYIRISVDLRLFEVCLPEKPIIKHSEYKLF